MGAPPRFADRRAAGRALAAELAKLELTDPVVLGIPRGGVVVAHEVAGMLDAPLDVLVVRKLGYPGHEEAGFGAVGEEGVIVPERLAQLTSDDPAYDVVQRAIESERAQVAERVGRYRSGRPRTPLAGRSAVVVDDGIATGNTFAAALAIARAADPVLLVAAAPVASWEGAELIAPYCDRACIPMIAPPGQFFAVSLHYERFGQVSDEQVSQLLE